MTGEALIVLAVLLVAAAAGAVLRWSADRRWGPRGVLAANAAASLVVGALTAVETSWAGSSSVWASALIVGGMTFVLALGTFSTVAVDAADRGLRDGLLAAAGLWALHLLCGVGAAVCGFAAVRLLG